MIIYSFLINYKLSTMSQTIINTRSSSNRSRVWIYFKICDGDSNRVRCNLCSLEMCNNGTTTVLWNHIKFKHSIDRNTTNHDSLLESNMTPTKIRANNSNNISNNNNNSSSNNNNNNSINSNNKNLRKNIDFITTDDDSPLTSMKPLPSTSISKNLISRLNQLSSPVIRKLKFWNKKSFQVNQYDPSFKVIYLGNLAMQLWSKDESCLDKPLSTLWNNYLVNMKTEIVMRLTICNSGLKAITRQHGLTQYWSNRLVYCCSHKNYPRIFSWVYRHEGKKMRQELRCHAVLCPSPEKATKMVTMLNQRLACALQEFRREKKSRSHSLVISNNQNSNSSSSSILSLAQKLPQTIPLRRQILAKGSANFRPPLERSKSAPKLTSILEEDDYDDEDEDDDDNDDFNGEEDGDDDDDNEDNDNEIRGLSDDENGGVNEVGDTDVDDDDDDDEDDVNTVKKNIQVKIKDKEDDQREEDDQTNNLDFQDELEFEESFGDRDDDDDDDNSTINL